MSIFLAVKQKKEIPSHIHASKPAIPAALAFAPPVARRATRGEER
jgi:hypothetical protein